MNNLHNRRTFSILSSLLLAAALLLLGLIVLTHFSDQVHARAAAATYNTEFGVIKRPGIATSFAITNNGNSRAALVFALFQRGTALTPVKTFTDTLSAGGKKVYNLGNVAGLPKTFYGWLKIASNQPFQVQILSPNKLIAGRVRYPNNQPVTDAMVVAHRVGTPDVIDTHTTVSGTYRIPVDGGQWLLSLVAAPVPTGTNWIYVDPPKMVEFLLPPDQPELEIVDFDVLPATGHLIGQVRMPLPANGTLAGLPVRVIARNNLGIGNEVWTDASGDFDLPVPRGVYNILVRPRTSYLAGPHLTGVMITSSTDIGVIHLLTPTAVITGQVTDSAGNGLNTIPGVGGRPARVIAWERNGTGWGGIDTDPQGYFTLPLVVKPGFPSEWMMRVEPPRVAAGDPPLVSPQARRVILWAGRHHSPLYFPLLPADGRIIGHVVDGDDNHLDLLGRAHALRHPRDRWPQLYHAPTYQGYFTLTVPTTHTFDMIYDVGVRPDPSSGYAPGYIRGVDPPTSGDATVTVTLQQRDALIVGALVDASRPPTATRIVTDVRARVFAINRPPTAFEGDWQSQWINPLTGKYRMGVVSGTWRLDFRVTHPQDDGWIPHPRFHYDPSWHLHQVDAGNTITIPLPVLPLNRGVTGVVKLGSALGPPVPFIQVCGRGIDPENRGIEVCTQTNSQGHYLLRTTTGHYRVRVILPQILRDRGFLEPDEEIVNPNAANVDFVVRRANASVHGRVTISATETITQPKVLVWGWSMNGSHVYTEVILPEIDTTGTFSVEASYAISAGGGLDGEVWYFGAAYESGATVYRCPRKRVVVHAQETIHLDLTLESVDDLLGRLPEPASVTFDRSLGVIVELGDMTINIPPGAIPADTDDVTLDIFPLGMLPEQRFEEVVGFGYLLDLYDGDGNAINERFFENVALTMSYSETLLALMGVDEQDIFPAYLSTTSGRWTAPESYVVDTVNNEVTLYIDHFTMFGALGAPLVEHKIYLPLMLRGFGG